MSDTELVDKLIDRMHQCLRGVTNITARTLHDAATSRHQHPPPKVEPADPRELLHLLDEQADAVRKDFELHQRDELIWESLYEIDEKVIVEADGYGGATALHYKELGGTERLVIQEQHYDDTDRACRQAAKWAECYGELYPDEEITDEEGNGGVRTS